MTKVKKISKLTFLFQKLPVDVVYLYGSRAGSQVDSFSDYDLGIVFSKNISPKKRFELLLELFEETAKILKVAEDNIDVVDLEKASVLLQFNAISGRVIYCRHEEQRVLFESSVMARYHDEHYYLNRYFWQTLAKIDKGGYFERPVPHSRTKI